MTKSIARQLVFFTIAIVSSSIVYSAAPSLLSIEGVNPDGRYNQGDTVNITAKFDDFISTSPNSQMSVTLNVGPETVDVPLTFSATSLVDKSFGVPNTVNAKGKGDASSEGIVMATELKVGANAGRIVVVGSFTEYENSGTGKAKMMVLNADGTIYKTFTSNSSSSFPHVAPQFDARNIQMVFETSEGKILVGGEFTNVWGDTAIDYLVQLNADFTLDTAFMDNLTPGSADSSNGQVGSSGTYGSASYYSANTPVVEQDGKLYIAGDFTQIAGVTTRHIACLNLDGTFCSGFTSPFTGGTRAMSLAIDDNKLWVVGQNMTVSGAGTNVDVWRLNLADGSVDNTYVNRLTGDLVGGIVVLPEIADGGVGGVAISGNSLDMAAHTSSSNGGTAVSTANNKPLFVINDDGTQNTNWSVQGNAFAVNPWSGEGFQIVKDKLFFGMHYAGNDLSADDIRDAAGYYKSLNSTACPSNTANGNNSTSDTCGVSSLMVFNLNDGSINQEFMDIIKAQGSFIKIDSSDDVHDFELLSDGGLLVVGSFSSYRATGAAGDSADDEAMIVKFRFDQLSGSYTVRSPSNDLTGLVKSTGISSYQISNIFDSSNVDTDGNAAYANLVSTNQRFEDNTKYAFNRELANAIELYAEDNSYPVPTVQDYIDEGATGVTAANLDDVNAAIDSLVGADVDTLAEIQSVVNAVNTDSDSDGVNNFFDTCPGTPSGLVVNASGCPAVASAPTVNPTSGNQVSGTAQAGSTVEVKNASGTLLCTTVADSSGNYNCTPLSPVPSNGAVLSVTADNSAGPSAAATATVDSAAPNAPIILVSNAAELSGTAEANSTVTIKDASGAVVATTTAGPDGSYSFTPNPLADGQTGSVTAKDAAGNESPATAIGSVDSTAPAAPLLNPSTGVEVTGTAEVASTVTITDAGGVVLCTTVAGATGNFSCVLSPVPSEGDTVFATSKDAAGNESIASSIVVGTDTDGDGIPDVIDTDDDNDGLSDTDEINIGTDPLNPDSDNDGVEDGKEVGADTSTPVDSDGDGTIDALDNSNDSDLDGLSNYLETLIGTDPNLRDSDSDDFRDDEELAVKLSGVDSDDDGIDDALDADVLGAPDEDGDGVADFAIRDTDGNGTPDVLDTDSDADGIDDINETLVDGDGDGIADVLDPVNAIGGGDSDGDFIPDAIECCHDSDKDGQPDYMQLDSDSDRINDVDEAGISGVDKDNDGYDDTYDADVDGDGVVDNGPDENADGLNDDWMPLDTDGDGLADYRDTDSDNDGISDEEESGYGSFPNRDTDGDGIPDRVDPVSGVDGGDSDGDGLSDKEECADGYPNCADSDGDGIPDYMDALVDEAPSPAPVVIDTDGDGLSDDEEATLGTDPLKSDTDDDGLSDFVEVTIGSNPIVADTDGDGILDGAENQDINGNGINDTREGYLKTSTKGGALGFIWAGLALLLVRRKHLLAVLAGLLSMVSVASANESESLFSADRVYVGAGLNYSRFSPETAGTGINITDRFDWGYSLSAGYDLFNQWSVNASYEDAGGLAADVLTTKETLDYKALSLLGRWYPTFLDNNERYTDNDRSWHWFVSGGFATVDTSGSLLADEQSSATLAYGIGANYQITESMLVEATVNRYSGDLLSYGLGITWYPFSNGSKKIEPAPEVIPEPEPEVVEVVEPEVVEPVVVEPVVEIQPCTSKSSRADILFDTNSSKLKSDFFDILDRAVVDYFACEESVITLVGFTDSSGSVRYNEKLSYKRADTVRTYLQERGIPSDHIVTISRGIDPSSGLPENEKRRVELYFGSY